MFSKPIFSSFFGFVFMIYDMSYFVSIFVCSLGPGPPRHHSINFCCRLRLPQKSKILVIYSAFSCRFFHQKKSSSIRSRHQVKNIDIEIKLFSLLYNTKQIGKITSGSRVETRDNRQPWFWPELSVLMTIAIDSKNSLNDFGEALPQGNMTIWRQNMI